MSKRNQINQAKAVLSRARRLVPGHPLNLLIDAEIQAINHGSDSFARLRQLTGNLQGLVGVKEPSKKLKKKKQSSSRRDRIQIVQGGSPQ